MDFLRYMFDRVRHIFWPDIIIRQPTAEMMIEKDVHVPTRDGSYLAINVFRPKENKPHPVIISFHPYGKDNFPKKGLFGFRPPAQYRLIRQTGTVKFSTLTTWEAPDPDFWVQQGYVVINADLRGTGKSPGQLNILTVHEGEDYYDLIEWAAAQTWSNGKVGLCGVSYLAISQYRAACLQPPHLAAICPWEGFSDVYKDLARPGAIREDGFFAFWTKRIDPSLRVQQMQHIMRDKWWQQLVPDLKKIAVPTLICASFSDQCLHTNGSFRAFENISSKQKWLYTHRTGKWMAFYSDEAKAMQLKFFNYFLKGEQNDLLSISPVRLEVRKSRDEIHRVSQETEWPLPTVEWIPLYLEVNSGLLSETAVAAAKKSFHLANENIQLSYVFPFDQQLIGPMKVKLYLEAKDCDDMNIFIGIRKFHAGKEVFFEGSYGYGYDIVTKGWQKASLGRTETEDAYKPLYIKRSFAQREMLVPGKMICLEIPLVSSATFFEKDDELKIDIRGNWFFKFNLLTSQLSKYEHTDKGQCILHSGGEFASQLLIPREKISRQTG